MNDAFKDRLREMLMSLWKRKNVELGEKLSQNAFADLLDLNSSALSEYLNRKRIPTLSQLERIAQAGSQHPEALLAELYGRSHNNTSQPIEEQIRSMDLSSQFELMKILVQEIAGGDPEAIGTVRKITPQMIEILSLEETIDLIELLLQRQRALLEKKVSR